MDKLANIMREMGQNARAASGQLRLAPAQQRASAIREAATAIEQASQTVLEANQKDMQRGTAKGISPAFLDRMRLDAGRVKAIADALRTIADQPDPLGVELQSWQQPNGLRFRKVAVPIGVIGIVYESRPNVTADAAALCLRSGNTAILRGGSDALQTSLAIFNAFQTGIIAAGLPEHCVQLVTVADRAAVGHLLAGLDNCLD
ncbi:MAG: gamma-glutamyl-phosphate reductase, partial [Robiginitomaculum sp.]